MIRDERGQALVEFAIMLPVLLLLAALVLFSGLTTYELTRLQGAANAAAQAGARELPDQDAAQAKALELAQANGYSEGVQVNTGGGLVEVVITNQLDYILPIPIDNPTLTGRAVYAGEEVE